jgi:hypothetical protein
MALREAFREKARLNRTFLLLALALSFVGLLAAVFTVRAQEQQAPARASEDRRQPIDFSHRIHATDNQIPCQFCHEYARRGPVAGIPSVQRCVQCHLTISPKKPEIDKLLAAWRSKKPIAWVRVHELPDYVRFTHKRHVLAGVACETCHGDVGRMDAAVQVASLTMGWCVTCHQERRAPTDCLVCHH